MEKALKYLGIYSGDTYERVAQDRLIIEARQSYHMLRGIILIYATIMLLLPWLRGRSFEAENLSAIRIDTANRNFILGMALLVSTLFFIAIDIIWERKKGNNYIFYKTLGFAYVAAIVLCTYEIMLVDYKEGSDFVICIVILLIVSALAILEPWQSIVIFGAAFALCSMNHSSLTTQFLQDLPYEGIDGIFASLVALAISLYLNGSRTRIYKKQETIEEQNERLAEVNERLSREISRDSLTGLYNRRYLTDIVHPEFHEGINRIGQKPLSCLMLDVDYFKQYNDTYGHQKGDECLVRISEIMKRNLPMECARIIRYGGEEFLIFISNCSETQALVYAEVLRKAVEEGKLMKTDNKSSHLTVSIGVCTETPNGISNLEIRGFIRKADEALYAAKRAGRNCVKVYKKEKG